MVCLCAYLPGLFTMPPVDRDESRFAQASRQVMEAADAWDVQNTLVPKVQDRPRLNKPPLIYWLQAVPAWLADRDASVADPRLQRIGWYRLPSVLCAILAVLATWRAGTVLYRGKEGFLGALCLAACPMVVWDAHQARADQLLLACTACALWALASIWKARRQGLPVTLGHSMAMWTCVGLGVLAKGPITPMVVVLALAVWWYMGAGWKTIRQTRPLVGVAVVVAMIGWWVVAVASYVGWGEYFSLIFDETIGRAGAAKESHWGPPGYHLVLLPVLFFPGSLVTLVALRRGWGRVRRHKRWNWKSPEALLLAWVVPSWIVFEAVMTKLPHYTLVLYPALALLGARTITVLVRARRSVGGAGVVVWMGIALALCAGPVVLMHMLGDGFALRTHGLVTLMALVCLWLMVEGARAAWRGQTDKAIQRGAIGMVGVGATLFVGPMTLLREPWVSSSVASALAEIDPAGARHLARTGYHEDSIVFLTRGRAERVGRGRLDEWLQEHPGGLVVYQSPGDDSNPPIPAGTRPLARVDGFNYSSGSFEEAWTAGCGWGSGAS